MQYTLTHSHFDLHSPQRTHTYQPNYCYCLVLQYIKNRYGTSKRKEQFVSVYLGCFQFLTLFEMIWFRRVAQSSCGRKLPTHQ